MRAEIEERQNEQNTAKYLCTRGNCHDYIAILSTISEKISKAGKCSHRTREAPKRRLHLNEVVEEVTKVRHTNDFS